MGTTGQLPISINIFSFSFKVKYLSISPTIGADDDVKLADFIGCDIDLTQVLKERIYREVEALYVVVYLGGDRSTSFS